MTEEEMLWCYRPFLLIRYH